MIVSICGKSTNMWVKHTRVATDFSSSNWKTSLVWKLVGHLLFPSLGDDGNLGNEHSHGSLLEAHGGERRDQHRSPGTPQRGASTANCGKGRGPGRAAWLLPGKPVETQQLAPCYSFYVDWEYISMFGKYLDMNENWRFKPRKVLTWTCHQGNSLESDVHLLCPWWTVAGVLSHWKVPWP